MGEPPKAGDILHYPYLWAWQQARGETEGCKPRPTAVAVTLHRSDGHRQVYLLAITSQPPDRAGKALEIPETDRRRAGLDQDRQLWIILDEYNVDTVDRSYYLNADDLIGRLATPFLRQVQRAFRDVVAAGGAAQIPRRDNEA